MHYHTGIGVNGSESDRDIVAWNRDLEKSQKAKRGLSSRNETPHPGEWSVACNPTRDPIASIEWKTKLPVNEKAELLQVEENSSVGWSRWLGSQNKMIGGPCH